MFCHIKNVKFREKYNPLIICQVVDLFVHTLSDLRRVEIYDFVEAYLRRREVLM